MRPLIYKGSRGEWKLWTNSPGAEVVDLKTAPVAVGPTGSPGPIPALLVPENGPFPGWMEFDVAGSRIVIGGDYDAATLEAVAQSVVDGLQAK